MRINRAKGLVARMLLVVSLLLGVVVLTGPAVQAQGRHWHRNDGFRGRVFLFPRVYTYPYYRSYYNYPYYQSYYDYPYQSYYFPSTHVTLDQGYHDGRHDGEDDAEDGKSYNPQRHNDYKNAQSSAYINGYLQGYEEGYQ